MWRSEFLRIRANSAFIVDLAEKLHVCVCIHIYRFEIGHLGVINVF